MSDDINRVLQAIDALRVEMREKVAAIRDDLIVLHGALGGVRSVALARLDRLDEALQASRNGVRAGGQPADQVQQDIYYLLETVCSLELQLQRLQTEGQGIAGRGLNVDQPLA